MKRDPLLLTISPICSIGKITPVSLLATIIETSAVSSVKASRSSSEIEHAVLIDTKPGDSITFLFQVLAQTQNRRMLDLSGDDVALIGPRSPACRGSPHYPFSATAGENNLDRIGGPDQLCDLASSLADTLAHLAAETMNARRIAVEVPSKNGAIASKTSGNTRVVALLSK